MVSGDIRGEDSEETAERIDAENKLVLRNGDGHPEVVLSRRAAAAVGLGLLVLLGLIFWLAIEVGVLIDNNHKQGTALAALGTVADRIDRVGDQTSRTNELFRKLVIASSKGNQHQIDEIVMQLEKEQSRQENTSRELRNNGQTPSGSGSPGPQGPAGPQGPPGSSRPPPTTTTTRRSTTTTTTTTRLIPTVPTLPRIS